MAKLIYLIFLTFYVVVNSVKPNIDCDDEYVQHIEVRGKMNILVRAIRALFALVVVAAMVAACSGPDEKAEKRTIKDGTDAIAQKGLEAIKTPLDKAKQAKELTEQHNRTVEEAAKQ